MLYFIFLIFLRKLSFFLLYDIDKWIKKEYNNLEYYTIIIFAYTRERILVEYLQLEESKFLKKLLEKTVGGLDR